MSRQGLSRGRRRSAHLLRPAETQLFSGRRALAPQGGGHRVRRPAAVRVRRPRAADQLAGERSTRRALGERAAPGAERRRRPLPRQLRRGAPRRPRARSTSPCAPPPRSPRATSAGATASASSPSAARCAGSLPGSGLASSTASSTRCSTRGSSLSYAWKAIDIVPARTLPPQALVIALTPLLDERSVRALLDLRARGFDLAVVELSPLAVRRPGRAGGRRDSRTGSGGSSATRCAPQFPPRACRSSSGDDGEPLAAPIEEVTAFRRYARLARV